MLRVLDPDCAGHADRLGELLLRFRQEEAATTRLLHEIQEELEFWQREAIFLRTTSRSEADRVDDRCRELQIECDLLATELVHVRMAISGTDEELAECGRGSRSGAVMGCRLPA